MAFEEEFDADTNAPVRRSIPSQPSPFFYIIIGIVIGFVLSLILSPGVLPGFGSMQQYQGTISEVNKFVSNDLRSNKVILRIDDTNIAVCTDGDNCLGYKEGDEVKVTCFGSDCQAIKK